ncbi:acyl-ACP thioesterase domain-containing protein [Paenibacillus sp.]|jgi:acyl-ACP thioesterase|uniref:acyl-[acyl-carrier-protein] thioesterase n=1 Tax=Paenibacillus sp. TaxID=58172 RepID=UPI00282EC7EB|nr:acyl-ACP thioesterase domain-containing protein [Paenibacillus sp.]MDR0267658.1 acyl-ACP thioesterase [Paenibacillus sp.]
MNNMWAETYLVHSNDIDYKSEARLSVLLALMQRTADAHLEHIGASRDQMMAQNMGWMLITMELRFQRTPKAMENITIQTWNKGAKGALWQRDFRIMDQAGNIVAEACSIWALVDIGKRKLLRPSAFPFEVPTAAEDSAGETPQKVELPENVILHEAYRSVVRYSGIDANGHLNNSRYADLCMDALSKEELDKIRIQSFKITYQHEALTGDEIEVYRSEIVDGMIYFKGQASDGNPYFEAYLETVLN